MKVLLVSNYLIDRQESMLRFASALAQGLQEAGIDVTVIRPEPIVGKWKPGAGGLGKWLGYLDKFLFFPPRLRRLAADADLVHICDHSNAFYAPHIAHRPHLLTCNDMLAIRSAAGEFPHHRTRATGRILQRWILSGLKRARRLTCISEATRRDVLRLSGHREKDVSVTYMGQNFAYQPIREIAEAAEARRQGRPYEAATFVARGLPAAPYILHVGGDHWYKNRAGVLAMYEELRRDLGENAPQLVLVGPAPAQSSPGVECRSGVGNEDLASLYSGAELLLFPSLEEGFGWPIIEAQACGCPVLTTGKAPMTEVGGAAARYLTDPLDAKAGAAAVRETLELDSVARARCVAAGLENAARFSAARMTKEYLAIYGEILARHRP